MWIIHDTAHITERYGQENQDEWKRGSRDIQGAAGDEICTMETDVDKFGCETIIALTK